MRRWAGTAGCARTALNPAGASVRWSCGARGCAAKRCRFAVNTVPQKSGGGGRQPVLHCSGARGCPARRRPWWASGSGSAARAAAGRSARRRRPAPRGRSWRGGRRADRRCPGRQPRTDRPRPGPRYAPAGGKSRAGSVCRRCAPQSSRSPPPPDCWRRRTH